MRTWRRPLSWLYQKRALTVAVGMSGGVDSSVAALLLKKAGHEVIGIHATSWLDGDEEGKRMSVEGSCGAEKEWRDAEAVCRALDIPCLRIDCVKEYWHNVFQPLLEDYSRGVTPNPDVQCNRYIKFSHLRDKAFSMGANYFATGHYARLLHADPRDPHLAELCKAVDSTKDQSYFLSAVPHKAFKSVIFPLGEISKAEVRTIAVEAKLPTALKAESMGLCFVGKRRFNKFLSEYLTPSLGDVRCVDSGRVLGQHCGLELYTNGQGARIGGSTDKLFVVRKDVDSHTLWVAGGTDHSSLFSERCVAKLETFNWITGAPPLQLVKGDMPVEFRARHSVGLSKGVARIIKKGGWELVEVSFHERQRCVAPGQILAIYQGERCIGGGPITDSN